MKHRFLLVILLLTFLRSWAQTTTLVQETFDTDGEGSRYTSNTFDLRPLGSADPTNGNGLIQYFVRGTTNPFQNPYASNSYSFGTATNLITLGNLQGTGFWASEAVCGTSSVPSGDRRPPGYVTLKTVNSTNYNTLKVIVALASPRGAPWTGAGTKGVRKTDVIRIDYSFNNAASWTTIGQFMGDEFYGVGQSGDWRLDVNLDGSASDDRTASTPSPALTQTFQDFTFAIPVTGNSLLVRVVVEARGGTSIELAFDNIRVTGILSNVPPPTLTGIESTTLRYAEGAAATQITNTVTASNPSGSTLSGAKVAISSGFVIGQDVLAFTAANGITGTYNASTGLLSLTGTASPAAYTSALRSVTYRNSNAADATAGTRAVDFSVLDGTASSSAQTRLIEVISSLSGPASLPFTEDFTTDGEGTRYGTNHFYLNDGIGYERTNANPRDVNAANTTFSNISNGYYFFGENTLSPFNPSTVKSGFLITQPVDATNYGNMHFQIRLGASPASAGAIWQTKHYFRLYYRLGGSSGSWVLFGSFRGNTTVINGNGDLRQDTDLTNLSGIPTGPVVTPTLTNFDFALPAAVSGNVVDFKLELSNDDSRSDFAFDLIQVTGAVNNPPTNITLSNSSISENQPTGSVIGSFSSTDADAGQSFSYSLVTGTGSTDNASFQIVGSQLRTNAVLNFETKSSYSIRVRTTDSGSPAQSFEKLFTINVTNINELTASITAQSNVSCNGGANGTANVTASGESAPFSYIWRNFTTNTTLAQTTSAVTGLTAGAYSVTVTASSSGFTATTSFTISQPSAFSLVTARTNVGQLGASTGTASVTVSGGTPAYTYDWTPGTPTGDGTSSISSLSAGTYSIKVTDVNGCTATSSTTVGTDPDLTVLLYARPNLLYGSSPMSVVVDVVENNGVNSSGLITVKVTKDAKLTLSLNGSLTTVNGRSVQNGSWNLSSDASYYILTTSQPVTGGNKLSFGLTGQLSASNTTGMINCSATLVGGSESRTNNNIDADKIEYFQQ
ncbi:cadherin repeat domain-containing protein [Spirosoma validum]|uniref:Cadherin domain-containing protein n=1 Tax=Spirosoma validum TaxID=2771355 RepID=A0A927B6P6_9BACT|nr:cadherin repeat domain-containing protein [Spirosoma validum]MBD2756298.1 cadherin domain-containing protein [Spirosoma validum]